MRPIQSNLSMTKVITRTDDSIKTTCQICTREVPLASLRSHMSECSSDSQDSFGASASSSPIFSESTRGEEAEDVNVTLLDNLPLPSHQQKEMWHKELIDLFPLHSQQAISRSLIGAASIEEAANNLIEVTTAGEEPKTVCKVKTNASLVSLLYDFRDSHSKEGFQEITIDRDAVWADTLRFYKRNIGNPSISAKTLEVEFKDGDGLDGGAIKVEFFSLVWEKFLNAYLMDNIQAICTSKYNTKLYLFRPVGMMLVYTVLQDANSPNYRHL